MSQKLFENVLLFMSMLDSFLQPETSIIDVFFYAHTVIIQTGKIILSHRVSLFGCCFKPFCSLGIVDRYTLSTVIHHAKIGLGFAVPTFCGLVV
ncbi:Uncharacterised protein [Mycobacteroides abscessus subsp. massiliense]|nr:Uncharacterised protein [Mycobacteroides abscessus subsp. massiliense]